MIFLNGYFRSQPVTGQQRYATELGNRLLRSELAVREVGPAGWTDRRRSLEWLDLQTRLLAQVRDSTLVSLTARAPAFVRRHVVTIHDLFPLSNPEWFSPSYVALHSRLLRYHLRHAAGIVVVSQPVLEEVRAYARPGTPIALVPNAPTTLGRVTKSSPESGSVGGSGYFLAVGNLEPRKNLPRLIEAHALLPAELRRAFPLRIVGGAAAAFRAEPALRDLTDPSVELMGRVSDEELSGLYQGATAFVSVSLAEGFGIPVIEAASVLRGALVLSDIPSYRWLADGRDIGIFVDPTSPESIADGLVRATSADVSLTGLREIADRFSWEGSATALLKLVETVDSQRSLRVD